MGMKKYNTVETTDIFASTVEFDLGSFEIRDDEIFMRESVEQQSLDLGDTQLSVRIYDDGPYLVVTGSSTRAACIPLHALNIPCAFAA